MAITCAHTDKMVPNIKPGSSTCLECAKTGDPWTSLRVCQTCGNVGCCESSLFQHAKKHFEETGHPIIKPLAGEDWSWCYLEKDYINNAK